MLDLKNDRKFDQFGIAPLKEEKIDSVEIFSVTISRTVSRISMWTIRSLVRRI